MTLTVLGGLLAIGSVSEALETASRSVSRQPVSARVTIMGAPIHGVPPVQSGFVGLSLEFPAVARYTSTDPSQPNRVLEQLIGALSPGAAPVLRIGGDSTDSTWWPVRGVRPPGVRYSLTPSWLASTRTLVRDLGARLIVGVNLEARRPALTIGEARPLLSAIGRTRVSAIEIGNEPSNYPRFPWYRAAGRAACARPDTYRLADFIRGFTTIRRGLPGVPLAGPTVGGYGGMTDLTDFLNAEPSVSTVTFHRYPLNRCFVPPGSPMHATLHNLLSAWAARDFLTPVRPSVTLAHADGARFRLDEFNSVSCSGKFGLSDTFASSLWSVDALFGAARDGVDGVKVHTFPGAAYAPFDLHRAGGTWSATVHPEYYGLLLFARAAPAGARLLSVGGRMPAGVRIWPARTAGLTHVVGINKNRDTPAQVTVRVTRARARASVEALTAPSVSATSGARSPDNGSWRRRPPGTLTGSAGGENVRPHAGATGSASAP